MSVAHFAVGDRVQVRNLEVEEGLAGHMRAPVYCRGFTGEIERFCGIFGNPESLAYGRDDQPAQPLYRVRFRQIELWPDYRGAAADTLEIEVYQHWLKAS